MVVDGILVRTIDYVYGFNNKNDCELFLEETQGTEFTSSADKSSLTGRNGRILKEIVKNPTFGISGTSALVSTALLRAATGATTEESEATKVRLPDIITIKGNTATTAQKAVGSVGNEIGKMYVLQPGGGLGTAYTQAAEADATHFSYDPSTKTITLPVDGGSAVLANESKIVAFYDFETTGATTSVSGGTQSKTLKLYIDASGEDLCGNDVHIQFVIPKAQFTGEFTLSLGGDQTVHNFSANAMSGGCGGSDRMYDYIVY